MHAFEHAFTIARSGLVSSSIVETSCILLIPQCNTFNDETFHLGRDSDPFDAFLACQKHIEILRDTD